MIFQIFLLVKYLSIADTLKTCSITSLSKKTGRSGTLASKNGPEDRRGKREERAEAFRANSISKLCTLDALFLAQTNKSEAYHHKYKNIYVCDTPPDGPVALICDVVIMSSRHRKLFSSIYQVLQNKANFLK